jgi:hypothetical protein
MKDLLMGRTVVIAAMLIVIALLAFLTAVRERR